MRIYSRYKFNNIYIINIKKIENTKHKKNNPVARIVKNWAASMIVISLCLCLAAYSFHHALLKLPQQLWFYLLNNPTQLHHCLL